MAFAGVVFGALGAALLAPVAIGFHAYVVRLTTYIWKPIPYLEAFVIILGLAFVPYAWWLTSRPRRGWVVVAAGLVIGHVASTAAYVFAAVASAEEGTLRATLRVVSVPELLLLMLVLIPAWMGGWLYGLSGAVGALLVGRSTSKLRLQRDAAVGAPQELT